MKSNIFTKICTGICFLSILFAFTTPIKHIESFIEEARIRTVVISHKTNGGNITSSGVLINNEYILTCAHAVAIYNKKDTVIKFDNGLTIHSYIASFAGKAKADSILVGRSKNEELGVSEVYIHPLYSVNSNIDLALLRLKTPLNIDNQMQIHLGKPELGDTILCLGYGLESIDTIKGYNYQQITNPWFNIITKIDSSKNMNFETNEKKQIKFAGHTLGRITSSGDSGGPSFVIKKKSIKLSGIHYSTIRNVFNEEGNTPKNLIPHSLDVNVAYFQDWINSIINQNKSK